VLDPSQIANLSPAYKANRLRAASLVGSEFQLVRTTDNGGKPLGGAYVTRTERARQYFADFIWDGDGAGNIPVVLSGSTLKTITQQMHRINDYKSGDPGVVHDYHKMSRRPKALEYSERVIKRYPELGIAALPDGRLRIKGIPDAAQPININRDPTDPTTTFDVETRKLLAANPRFAGAGGHIYPNDTAPYFARGAEILAQIKYGIVNGQSASSLHTLIGDYYHVMVNARPFANVNQTIFMNQVNYLLRLTGHDGLLQGHLDHLFMRLDSDQAQLVWKEVLKGSFPTAPDLGVDGLE
jgi:hypothetical protein